MSPSRCHEIGAPSQQWPLLLACACIHRDRSRSKERERRKDRDREREREREVRDEPPPKESKKAPSWAERVQQSAGSSRLIARSLKVGREGRACYCATAKLSMC
jgi:hypothetical protein